MNLLRKKIISSYMKVEAPLDLHILPTNEIPFNRLTAEEIVRQAIKCVFNLINFPFGLHLNGALYFCFSW